MVRLFRYSSDKLLLDSDDFPDDVFATHKCKFDWYDGTVMIYDTIYATSKGQGIWYYLPFDVLDKNWINKGGYQINNIYYPNKSVNFNPSGNPDNLWMTMYSKTTNNVIYPNAVILYKYDTSDNMTDYFRVMPSKAKTAQSQAATGNFNESIFKMFTGGGVL